MLNRQIIVLVVILAALSSGIYYFVILDHNTSITNINTTDVSSIYVFSVDKELLDLKKEDNHWNILVDNQYYLANQKKVQAILKLLKAQPVQSFNVGAADFPKYGFNKPHLRVRFDDLSIRFGDVNPLNNLRYIKIYDTVYLIKDEYYRLLLSRPQDLRQN